MYLKNLTVLGFKSFADKTSLNFQPGVTAIVGPNGAGKTTYFNLISGQLPASAGTVLLPPCGAQKPCWQHPTPGVTKCLPSARLPACLAPAGCRSVWVGWAASLTASTSSQPQTTSPSACAKT